MMMEIIIINIVVVRRRPNNISLPLLSKVRKLIIINEI